MELEITIPDTNPKYLRSVKLDDVMLTQDGEIIMSIQDLIQDFWELEEKVDAMRGANIKV